MGNVLVIGASGHAKVVIDVLERSGHAVAGTIDPSLPVGSEFFGRPVLGRDENLPQLVERYQIDGLIVAVGDNWRRAKIANGARSRVPYVPFVSAVHPTAAVGRGAVIGPGSVLMAGAVVNPDARVGDHCIVNTRASIDHDGRLDDFASLGPGTTVGGNASIGAYAAVGIGATVLHGRTVGAHAVIGAGAVVARDLPESVVAYGVPARVVRPRAPGDRYL